MSPLTDLLRFCSSIVCDWICTVGVSVLAGSVGSSNIGNDESGTTVAGKISGSSARITCVLVTSLVIK